MALLDSLDDPDKQALLAMGLGMLAPKQQKTSLLGDIGQSGLLGLQTLGVAKQQERQNRQSDIQTLAALQKSIYARELPKMLQQGDAYVPPPDLQAINKSLNDLAIAGNLTGKTRDSLASYTPQSAPPAPQSVPGVASPSAAPMADPNYQPVPGMVRPNSSTPAPAYVPPPQAPQAGSVPSSVFGVPMSAFAAASMAGNQGVSDFLKAAVEARKPLNGRPGGTQTVWDEATQTMKPVFYSPKLDSGIQPQFGPNGQVSAGVMPGYQEALATLKGAESAAAQKGKQAETYVDVPIGNNQTMRMTNAQYEAARAAGRLSGAQQPIPQAVIDADRSGQPFNATQAPGGPVQFQPPPQGGQPSTGTGGGLGVTANPVAQAGAIANVESAARARQDAMKKDYQTLSDQNANAQTVISRLQTMRGLGPQAIMGAESDKRDFFNGLLSLAGIKSAVDAKTASDLVDKNAGQIALAIGAGSNGTDALRSLAISANPGRHMTLDAFQRAVDSVVAPLQVTQAKTDLLTPHFTGGDTSSYFTKKTAFEKAADPRIWELQTLAPDAQRAYISTLSPADAKKLLSARTSLKQLGALQ